MGLSVELYLSRCDSLSAIANSDKTAVTLMVDFHLHIASTLGLLLGICLAAGLFADVLHLPKVTAYLLVGLLVGPSVLDLIPEGHVELFEPVLKLAMAVVLFNLGCEFTFTKVRRVAAHCLALSAAEIATTCGLVTFGLLAFGCSGSMALLLGCLAVATAPATTISGFERISLRRSGYREYWLPGRDEQLCLHRAVRARFSRHSLGQRKTAGADHA